MSDHTPILQAGSNICVCGQIHDELAEVTARMSQRLPFELHLEPGLDVIGKVRCTECGQRWVWPKGYANELASALARHAQGHADGVEPGGVGQYWS